MKIEKQSLGEIFKEVRKEKGLTLDEISKETNIPKRYLEAIEDDNLTVFSSETYAIGFISTYCEALEIDKDLVLAQYKRLKKIEEDSPIEALVGEKKTDFSKFLLPSIIVLSSFILLIIIFLGIRTIMNKNSMPKTYYFSQAKISRIYDVRFKVGDVLNITNEERTIEITFDNVDKMNNLNFKINNNSYSIKGNGLLTIDSDYDGTNDMNIEFFSTKPNYIRLNLSYLTTENLTAQNPSNQANQTGINVISEKEWYKAASQKEIVMKVFASENCWIAYKADDKEEKNLYLSAKGEHIILFSNKLTLYSANNGAIKIGIEGKEETLGGFGEVGKSIFYWKKRDKEVVLVQAVLK
ncbi:MAG: helix-turn-helix domain-containing protein [Brevinematales bacterium]|nr:helix-turn-helix domain-containing protein [Brevinematales bacterium]